MTDMTDSEFEHYTIGFEDGKRQAIKHVFKMIKESDLYKEMIVAELQDYIDEMADSDQYKLKE